jgi:hypothetical protein
MFKKGDKVTIKDIDAVISVKFQDLKRFPDYYKKQTLESLEYLLKNYGIYSSQAESCDSCYVKIEKYDYLWCFLKEHIYPYRDISIPEDLFKI